MKLTLDKAGRVLLPKLLRDELGLEPGDVLEIETSGEELILRRPRSNRAHLRKKRGVWVYSAGEPLSATVVEKTIRQIRQRN